MSVDGHFDLVQVSLGLSASLVQLKGSLMSMLCGYEVITGFRLYQYLILSAGGTLLDAIRVDSGSAVRCCHFVT